MGMTKFEVVAVRLRSRPLSMALLLLSMALLVMLFLNQSHREQAEQKAQLEQYGESLLLASQSRLEHQIAVYRDWLQAIRQSDLTQSLFDEQGPSLDQWQTTLKQMVPGLQHACIFEQDLLTPESDCMPLSYVSLDVMRSLDDTGIADIVLINKEPQSSHILLATKLSVRARPEPLKLLVALDPAVLFDGMKAMTAKDIYLEIVQGQASEKALKAFGEVSLKQGVADKVLKVKGSQWQFRLWTGEVSQAYNWPYWLSIIFLVSIAWLLREWWYNKTLRHDSATLEEQLSDLQQLKMRNRYPVINPELTYVSQAIHQIGIPQRHKNPVRVEAEPVEPQVSDIDEASESEGQRSENDAPAMSDEAEIGVENLEESVALNDNDIDTEDEAEAAENNDVIEYDPVSPDDARLASLQAHEKAQSVSYEVRQQPELVDFNANLETIDIASIETDEELDDAIQNETAEDALDAEQAILDELTEQAEEKEKTASSDMVLPDRAIFRKYDIRGVVGEQLTVPVMRQLGRAVGSMLVEQGHANLNVGCDARLSSPPLTKAFIRGVLSTGCDVCDYGQIPTPLLYFANVNGDVTSGAIITGSHNPTDFNGLKLVINGKALLGEEVAAIYERIKADRFTSGQGVLQQAEIFDSYLQAVQAAVQPARQVTVVVDCGNSIAGRFLPKLLRSIGCKVIELYCDVDGRFPNHHPDPGQPDNLTALQQMVKSNQADLGLAVDGDADRLGVVDSEGKIIWPDRLLALFAQQLLEKEAGATVLFDIKCSLLVRQLVEAGGGRAEMVAAGHSVIKAEMLRTGAMLAGEMTGHFFFKDRWYGFDDAMYAACRLVELLSQTTGSSAELFAAIPEYESTPEIIIRMPETDVHDIVARFARDYDASLATVTTIDGVRVDFEDGWGLLRASNTMPAISLRFEAVNKQRLEAIKQSFLETLREISPRSRFNF